MIVAITGHRPNRMHIGAARVAQRLRQVLRQLKQVSRATGTRRGRLLALSALAEGSDRLFATTALDLGYRLHAVLPFASIDYETTFGDDATTADYRALLARAESVEELPGTLTETTAAYEAMGRAAVDRCDVLVTVWDGKPAAGRGGTPEILQYAIDTGKPILWIDAARDRPPLLLSSGSRRQAVQLARLAPRARRASIARLALLSTSCDAQEALPAPPPPTLTPVLSSGSRTFQAK